MSDYLPPVFEGIPQELQAFDQWVAWKAVPNLKKGKPDKIPLNPGRGYGASSTNPATWGTYAQALAFCRNWLGKEHSHTLKNGITLTGPVCGVGFVLTLNDPFVGIDLDNCFTPEGYLSSWAQEIINNIRSYTERSPSGEGIRIFTKGKLPGEACRVDSVEVYEQGRYLTVTGRVIAGTEDFHVWHHCGKSGRT